MLIVCETFNVHLRHKGFLYGVTLNNVKLVIQLRIQLIQTRLQLLLHHNLADGTIRLANNIEATAQMGLWSALQVVNGSGNPTLLAL